MVLTLRFNSDCTYVLNLYDKILMVSTHVDSMINLNGEY